MSMYICDSCNKRKDNDRTPCHDVEGINETYLICNDCTKEESDENGKTNNN